MLQRGSPMNAEERCMYRRNRMSGRVRKLLIGVAAATLAGGAFAVSTGMSSAGENCAGLDGALRNNLDFIAGQRADPDALSEARIANRQAVVDLINQRRAVAGCTADVAASVPGAAAPAGTKPANPPKTTAPTTPPATGTGAGSVVCKGSTVTLSGESGAPFASSGTFPIGTTLKVTNLDNNKSIMVKVQTPSGSGLLLNKVPF